MATYDLTSSIPASTDLKAGDILNCPYSGTYKTIVLPKGIYKLEVWGAQGGSYSSFYGGYGGYSYGELTLTQETVLYLYAGGQPATNSISQSISPGGYNGGGQGAVRNYSSTYSYGQGGGGASDIRIGQNDLYARVIVAGGGGGSSSVNANTTKCGGGLAGSSPQPDFASTATSAGIGGSFGVGASTCRSKLDYKYGSGGGGGGWYGGGAGVSTFYVNDSTIAYRDYNGGGSGYVYTNTTVSQYPSGCLLNSAYYLNNADTISGNISIIDYSGLTTIGHSGHGACRITVIKVINGTPFRIKINDSTWKEAVSGWIKVDSTTWKEITNYYLKTNSSNWSSGG